MAAKPKAAQTTPEPTPAPAETPVPTPEPESTPVVIPTPEPVPTASTVKALRVTAKVGGFRRGGIAHPAEPTVYRDGELTEAQIALIKSEPMLVVEEIDVDA